jgi:hypothetical protein
MVPRPITGEDCQSLHLPFNTKRDTRLDPTERFGDNIPLKPKGTLRIGFQNIGGFTQQTRTVKEDFIRIGITSWEFDIFGTAETNLDWRLQTEDNKLWSRTKEWWEHLHISYAHNNTFPPIEDKQYGGTALFTINDIAHRVVDKGRDNTNLGRWCWTTLRGKNCHTITIITAYRPNPPQAGVMGVLHPTLKIL